MANNPGTSGHTSQFIGSGRGSGRAPIFEDDGSIVLSREARDVLDKWDADRRARNSIRAERRLEDNGEDVSEDEEDKLAPFILGGIAPTGENPHPEGANIVPPNHSSAPATSVVPGKLLFEDGVAEKNTFRAHDKSIPASIYSLAKNGICPPLSLFLPASLERIRSSNVKTLKHGTGESTKVTVIDVSEFPDEQMLDQSTFLTCYNTFLTFLEDIVDFDRKIRAQFFTSPYIITANCSTEGANQKFPFWHIFKEFPISQSVLHRFA
ncbi:hypothetical protein DFH07DRAFT_1025059 [Mycena maculata]|uniref:Uncharacterized protein n=1 Tax=Mycena maculata TaxID=230809 RepID=A0AAD7NF72_9AGAR|nr:hypothetical protein DFH07DRAFT_1025059 [Mycena maculata]